MARKRFAGMTAGLAQNCAKTQSLPRSPLTPHTSPVLQSRALPSRVPSYLSRPVLAGSLPRFARVMKLASGVARSYRRLDLGMCLSSWSELVRPRPSIQQYNDHYNLYRHTSAAYCRHHQSTSSRPVHTTFVDRVGNRVMHTPPRELLPKAGVKSVITPSLCTWRSQNNHSWPKCRAWGTLLR